MKAYPIYKVKAKYPVTLASWNGDIITIAKGEIGSFQARPDSASAIDPLQPDKIIIDAVFGLKKATFRPKSYIPNGNIIPAILGEFDIIRDKAIKNTPKINTFSNVEGDALTEKIVVTKEVSKVTPEMASGKYIKQSYFIAIVAGLGALNGFDKARTSKSSTFGVIATTLVYAGLNAIGAWATASIINKKI